MRKKVMKSFLFACLCLFNVMVFTSAGNPIDVPGRPGRPEVFNIERDKCDIRFNKPDSDGGARIEGYLVESRDKYSDKWVKRIITRGTSCTVPDLTEGDELEFRVIASNKAGFGEPSYPSNSVIIRDPQKP